MLSTINCSPHSCYFNPEHFFALGVSYFCVNAGWKWKIHAHTSGKCTGKEKKVMKSWIFLNLLKNKRCAIDEKHTRSTWPDSCDRMQCVSSCATTAFQQLPDGFVFRFAICFFYSLRGCVFYVNILVLSYQTNFEKHNLPSQIPTTITTSDEHERHVRCARGSWEIRETRQSTEATL